MSGPAPTYGGAVVTARDLPEALALRAQFPEAVVLAGGTDLMVMMEAGQLRPGRVLNLWGCAGLRTISEDGGHFGALATWTDVARHPAVHPALRECARTVGALQIQNRGTVGGNIVNASPAGDSLPLWLALDAVFEVASLRGARRIAAADFWVGYRRTALAPDELLTGVTVAPAGADAVLYRKVGTRLAQAISKVVVGARIRQVEGTVTEARIALGSVGPVPLRARRVEALLVERGLDPDAADAVVDDIAPIDDVRSTAVWRRQVAQRVLRRWLVEQRAFSARNARQ